LFLKSKNALLGFHLVIHFHLLAKIWNFVFGRIPKDLPWLPENTELQLEVKIPLAEGEGPDRAQGIWK